MASNVQIPKVQDPEQVVLQPPAIPKKKHKEYDPFARPPNVTIAQKHGDATRYGEVRIVQGGVLEKCPCCGLPTIVDDIDIMRGRKSLVQNGPGIALYFDFILFCIVILSLYGLLVAIYNINVNRQGQRCLLQNYNTQSDCNPNFYNKYSLSNRTGGVDVTSSVLNFLAIIFIMILTFQYRKIIEKIAYEIDKNCTTVSDYSLMISNIPRDSTENEILQFFLKDMKRFNYPSEIRKIGLGYEITQYLQIQNHHQEKQDVLTLLLNIEKPTKQETEKIKELNEDLQQLQDVQDEIESDPSKSSYSGVCFITFNTEQQTQVMRDFYSQGRCSLFTNSQRKFRQKVITVTRAPEPGDVLWQNLGITPFQQIRKKMSTALASIFVLAICFGIILGVQLAQSITSTDHLNDKSLQTQAGITIFGFGASLLISVINVVLGLVIRKFAHYERHTTQTQFNISVAKKLGIAQFLNTAIITLIANIIVWKLDNLDLPFLHQIWRQGGLNYNVNLILMTNAVFAWISLIIEPDWLLSLYRRRQIIKQGDKCNLTQKEANTIFEGTEVDLAQKYAQVAKTIMLTFFYAYLLPIGVAFAILSLIIQYWVEKVILLRRDSKPAPLSDELAEEMVNFYVEIMMILLATGCVVWESYIYGAVYPLTTVSLAMAIIFYIMPIREIQSQCYEESQPDDVQTYDQVKNMLWDDYDRRNPLTMQKALKDWVKNHSNGQLINTNSINGPQLGSIQVQPYPQQALPQMNYNPSKIPQNSVFVADQPNFVVRYDQQQQPQQQQSLAYNNQQSIQQQQQQQQQYQQQQNYQQQNQQQQYQQQQYQQQQFQQQQYQQQQYQPQQQPQQQQTYYQQYPKNNQNINYNGANQGQFQ